MFGLSALRSEAGGWDGGPTWDFPGGAPEHGWQARFDWMLGEGLLYDEKITFGRSGPGNSLLKIEYSSLTDLDVGRVELFSEGQARHGRVDGLATLGGPLWQWDAALEA
ncbi:hypothetical protein [Paraburkholderia youngii]|uniref:Uncharacterized protein n=1 Tax=Paraburkholderia youngii TaxID=2782701 RepID=A0A7W8L8W9_9BURK|nr:hypothetical protein [Paraburkholderia youngii]MBB5402637.1 hypothetical protein [Paraburkholderia youngii]